MERLRGQIIREIRTCPAGQSLTVVTDEYRFHYITEGDCCAHAYLLDLDEEDVKSILNREVMDTSAERVSVEASGWGQVDTDFYTIKTHGGDLNLELRTEHNGYYCGWLKHDSTEKIWPVFNEIREEAKEEMR